MDSSPSTDTDTRKDRSPTRYQCTRQTWWISVTAYNHRGERFSAAHFIATVLQRGGQEAAIQTARALRIFGVWNDRSVQRTGDEGKVIESIGKPLQGREIINAIWPHSVEGTKETLLAWAKRTDDSLEEWEDAHDTLLRQYLGRDLCISQRSEEWDDGRWFSEANSSITEDHFRNVIAPLLETHFSTSVDLESLWELVLTGPWVSVDRRSTRASSIAAYQDTSPDEENEINGSATKAPALLEEMYHRSQHKTIEAIQIFMASKHKTAHLWQQIVDRRIEEAQAVADELAELDDM